MLELGLFIDDGVENQISSESKTIDQKSESNNDSDEKTETDKAKEVEEVENDKDHGSIESVPFISQPAKKSTTIIRGIKFLGLNIIFFPLVFH